jgi:hypothetical protein
MHNILQTSQQFATRSVAEGIPTRSVGTSSERRGAALVMAVVALTVCSVMLFYLLKGALDTQRQMRTHRQEVQADWLAAAGIDRALATLRRSPDYTGETWQIPADQLGDAAEVVIKVEPAAESNSRQITVQADYPGGTIHRTRKTRETTIQIP